MSYTFTKLFSSITSSTVWMEPSGTRLTWIAMLANCDRKGRVFASMPGLAHLARVTLVEAEIAIRTFLAPDPYSRTPDNEGRRIVEIDGGWQLLNHEKYRGIRDEETIREAKADYMRRKRAEDKSGTVTSTGSTVERGGSNQKQIQMQMQKQIQKQDLDQKPKAGARGARLPADWEPSEELKAYATSKLVDWKLELEAFRDWWAAAPGQKGVKVDWDATWRTWVRRAKPTLSAAASRPIGAKAALAKTEDPLQHAMSYARQRYERGEFGEVGTVAASDAFAEERRRITEKHRGKN